LKNKGVPAKISFNPGTYICNYTYFNCLQNIKDKDIETVFIHVPSSPKEVIELDIDIPTFPTYLIAEGLFDYLKNLK